MSAHLPHELLWALDEQPAEALASARAHLGTCAQCRTALEDITFSKSLLADPGPVPPLPDASARRIGEALFAAAAAQSLQRPWWRAFWPFELNPGFALAGALAAVLALLVYFGRPAPSPTPGPGAIAQPTPLVVPPPPVPRPIELQPPETVAPAKKLVASVTSARGARDRGAALKKAQVLEEGAQLATAKGGALWVKLPDGSRAGLSGDSTVQLTTLEDRQVALALNGGSLVMVARHRPDRTLTVRAGELEVVDVGTRFLVSRDVRRTLVAVEEGSVEVRAPGKTTAVKAGQAVEWRDGKLTTQTWAQADEPAPRAPPAPELKPAEDSNTPPIAPLPPEAATAAKQPPPPEPGVAPPNDNPPDEWATPESLKNVPPALPPPVVPAEPAPAAQALPVPPPAPAAQAVDQPVTREDEAADENFLQKMERKLRELRAGIHPPFDPTNLSPREAQAKQVTQLADDHSCPEALKRADAWLQSAPTAGDDVNLKRSVLRAKLRCFNHQGRTGEAEKLQREIDRL